MINFEDIEALFESQEIQEEIATLIADMWEDIDSVQYQINKLEKELEIDLQSNPATAG